MHVWKSSIANITLDSAGLIALADLSTVSERTALIGTAWLSDILFLAPGLHRQQAASSVNGGELPAVAAMTTGFVFRIENQAMVFWLQRVGRPGCLVSARVERVASDLKPHNCHAILPLLLYATGVVLTIVCFTILGYIRDFWALGVLAMLVVARALNVAVIRRRAVVGWKGAKEPGVHGDLLVLLSQDRWVRIRGLVDDLKLVTSGQWVRDMEPLEGFCIAVATLLVYSAAALGANASTVGNLVIAVLLLVSVALLGLCNSLTRDLCMFDCHVYECGEPKLYERRVHMAEEMIEEHGSRRDWAVQMGLVLPQLANEKARSDATEIDPAPSLRPSTSSSAVPTPTFTTSHSPSPSLNTPSPPPPFILTSRSSTNNVPMQLSYRGPHSIPPSLADQQISDPHLLLVELNSVLGTSHSFESIPSLRLVLQDYTRKGLDFGTIYGLLRRWWSFMTGLTSPLAHFQSLERNDDAIRRQAVTADMVVEPMLPPRRVWDLYSNRVLPIWAIETDPLLSANSSQRITPLFAVSHAWILPSERQGVWTRINGQKWPVPVPNDSNLDDIRIELLNMGAEYVWLDVLCLRQMGGETHEEIVRAKEWEIDVPTIGAVYARCQSVIVYLNGLGRPFEENDLESTRHWCNRAWTLQEWSFAVNTRLAGVTAQSPAFKLTSRGPIVEGLPGSFAQRLRKKIASVQQNSRYIFQGAVAMSTRSATSEFDRIAGLAFNFAGYSHPAFYQEGTVEAAWLRFVRSMSPGERADMLFLFPVVGEGRYKSFPSWPQLLQGASEQVARVETLTTQVMEKADAPSIEPDEDFYTCRGVLVSSARVAGFGISATAADSQDLAIRQGTLTFDIKPGQSLSVHVCAYHHSLIPDGSYALFANLGHYNSTCRFWVVGTYDDEARFSKISVLQRDRTSEDDDALKVQLYKALDLSESEDGGDVRNMASKWVQRVTLT